MEIVDSIYDIPTDPAVYVMYGGKRQLYVAYVGIGGNLKDRLTQHFIRQDSSVTTGASAVTLNIELIKEVRWWTHPDFNQKTKREAAELVAFDIFNPALKSRGGISKKARDKYKDDKFRGTMRKIFEKAPTGKYIIPDLKKALKKIQQLEERIIDIEKIVFKDNND